MVDHIFICTAPGAPAAARLIDLGLQEGSSNRRFFFRNAMLELIWVENPAEAQSEPARPLRLWERWSGDRASPVPPFPTWEYRPATTPDLLLHIASGTGMTEPFWAFMPAGRRLDFSPDLPLAFLW